MHSSWAYLSSMAGPPDEGAMELAGVDVSGCRVSGMLYNKSTLYDQSMSTSC